MADTVVNEVLCFIQNHCSTHSRDELLTILGGFYHGDEILEAKMKLFDVVECHRGSAEGMPRLITRKQSNDKQKLDCQDLLALMYFVDGQKLKLPTFAAANLRRIPPFNPSDADVCCLASNVCDLRNEVQSLASLSSVVKEVTSIRKELAEMAELKKSVDQLKSMVLLHPDAPRTSSMAHDVVTVDTNENRDGTRDTVPQPQDSTSWAATAAQDLQQWNQVRVNVPKQPRRPVKVTGKRLLMSQA